MSRRMTKAQYEALMARRQQYIQHQKTQQKRPVNSPESQETNTVLNNSPPPAAVPQPVPATPPAVDQALSPATPPAIA